MNLIDILTDTTKTNRSPLRTVLQGSLRLTRLQEDKLMLAVRELFDHTRKEMGWIDKNSYDDESFLEKRQRAWAEYENDFRHRENGQRYGPLYKLFNNSLNIPKRAVRVFKARACEQLVNTEPFVSMAPEGVEDIDPGVKQGDRYFGMKLKERDSRSSFREGIEHAAVSGEGVIKITQFVERTTDRKKSKIWMNGDGTPLRDSRNRLVRENAITEPDPDALEGKRLKLDPSVKITAEHFVSDELQLAIEAIAR